jgi:hypothetical protein
MTNNKQQTAVDSLKDFFKQYDLAHSSLDYYEFKIPMHIFDLKFQQAKEIEKQRIIDAHYEGQCDETEGYPLEIAEKYYEQTYGGGEQ